MLSAVLLLTTASADLSIIPWPTKVEYLSAGSLASLSGHRFRLDERATIDPQPELKHVASLLRRYLSPATGFQLRNQQKGDIRLSLDPRLARLGSEGYTLRVTPRGIDIKASTEAGIFYGIQTFRQLLHPKIYGQDLSKREWATPLVYIEDSPRFKWRGAHMDVSRHFMPKESVLKFLDSMAMHKLNTFHWHLTDDHGWRIEIKKYPKLTEVGSKSDFSSLFPDLATRAAGQKVGGYYTQEEIKEVVRYAAERHITVVPEIELPGHSFAAIRAYPELGNGVKDWDNVYNVQPETIQFLKNVLDEVLELFPSEFIHIGGDEVDKSPWRSNPAAQAKKNELGLKSEEELQSWFIKQIDAYLVSKGRRLIGWDEILEGGLAEGATVMSWRGISGGIAAAKAGHDVVMTPTSHAYFDYGQGLFADEEPRSFGGYIPLEMVYEFEPVPAELNAEEAKHVLGAQANLWSEYIPTPEHMEYMAYPRLCAMAEVLWSSKAGRSWPGFKRRLETHLLRLKAAGVNFRALQADPLPIGGWKSGETTEDFHPREWPVSVNAAGTYDAVFLYTSGAHRLDIQRVELLQDGEVIASDEHLGQAGFAQVKNRYKLVVPSFKPGAAYVVRASIRSDGGTDSNGNLYFFPARRPE